MKKFLITLIIIAFGLPGLTEQSVEQAYETLNNLEQHFFEAPVVPEPEISVQKSGETKNDKKSSDTFKYNKPYFMKMRIKLMNALNERQKISDEKYLQRQKKLEAKERQKEDEKFKYQLNDIKYVEYDGEDAAEIKVKDLKKEPKPQKPEIVTGGVSEQTTKNEMLLDCDKISVNEETGEIEAIGKPVLILPEQNIKLTSDKMYYNNDANILKAVGNVVLLKDGMPVYGDYMQINMNEENIFMDNVNAAPPKLRLSAKTAVSEQDKLILTDGRLYSENSTKYRFISRMIGPAFSNMVIDEEDRSSLMGNGDSHFKISASHILVNPKKYTDTVTVKDAEIYHNDKYLFTLPSFTAHTDKNQGYVEANYPEFGSMSRLGSFFGPGLVLDTPFNSSVKLIPFINYKKDLGIGGAVKYHSAFNTTNFMYGSSNDIFVLRGKQILDENLFLQYGANAYMDNWFLGRRMPKYNVELVYHKGTKIKDFVAEGKDLTFNHRASFGYMQDGDWNMHTEHIQSSDIGTTRLRYMAEAVQSVYKHEDKENRRILDFDIVMQGSAAVYGTGDTQFIGRIGPRIHTQYKYWMQDLGYFLSAYSDHTPMPVYDMYRYGHSSVYLREAFRVNKYLSVGWSGTVTLTNDSPNGKPFQENAFYVSLGPDDFKVNLGYDIMRRMTYFTVALLLDTKDTVVNFDKMEIKNPEMLGRAEKEDDNVAFKQADNTPKVKKNLQYAQVIDIEDPDKEQI